MLNNEEKAQLEHLRAKEREVLLCEFCKKHIDWLRINTNRKEGYCDACLSKYAVMAMFSDSKEDFIWVGEKRVNGHKSP